MADAQERVESDPELESVEEGEEETANKFANDGSFMDMFKKRLDELKKEVEANETPDTKDSPPRTIVPSEEEVQRVKIYQGATGKRKALLKSAELREKKKKRKEEMEEQKHAEEGQYKSAAWKAYMQEVKAIQDRSCTDQEGHKRPLVK